MIDYLGFFTDHQQVTLAYKVVSKCFKTSYKEVLHLHLRTISFKTILLQGNTVLPAFLPLLECVFEVFFLKCVKHILQFTLTLRSGAKTPTFEMVLHPWIKSEVRRN